MSNKHAFLIMAHSNFKQLQLLVNLLDDSRNDIFVHIDKKSKILPQLEAKHAGLVCLKKRIDVRWGDVSQIETELLLFETAFNHGPYECYHLLSGVDLPIKSNDYIHDFIKKHPNTEFVGFSPETSDSLLKKVCRYHLFTKHYRNKSFAKKVFYSGTRCFVEAIVNLFVKRKCKEELKKGANWVSITHDFCKYILHRKNELIKQYQHTFCCDEIFIQTLLWNSPFKSRIYSLREEFEGCMRLIDWNRGRPYVWGSDKLNDENQISSSKSLFARKFDMNKHPEIVSYIRNMLIHE